MNPSSKQRLSLTAASVVAIVAATGAVAAASPGHHGTSGSRQATTTTTVTQTIGDRLDQAVKDGVLTQAQADTIKARIGTGTTGAGAFPFGGAAGGPGPGFGPFGGALAGFDTVAKSLGLTTSELCAKLAAGTSLADIATAQGKDVATLKSTLANAIRTQLDAALKAGTISQAAHDDAVADIDKRVGDLVDGKATGFGPFGTGKGAGFGPFGPGTGTGPGPWGGGASHGGFGPPWGTSATKR